MEQSLVRNKSVGKKTDYKCSGIRSRRRLSSLFLNLVLSIRLLASVGTTEVQLTLFGLACVPRETKLIGINFSNKLGITNPVKIASRERS